jgi:hypothetical protein
MRRNRQRSLVLCLSLFGVLSLCPALMGQGSAGAGSGARLPNDWTHHHVIFSQPATAEQAKKLQKNPRYLQQLRRQSPMKFSGVEDGGTLAPGLQLGANAALPGKARSRRGDWSVDLGSGATVGALNYPAKFSFDTEAANCASAPQPDFVVYGTGLAGATDQASIVAFANLYTGCMGPTPAVYWAYNTGGTVTTSPVYSIDGTQIAFVQTNASGHGVFVLLKWAPLATATIATPVTLTRVTNADYPTCVAPCMTTTLLRAAGGAADADTNSSVFFDYSSHTAYVGDDAGFLHEITQVFDGIPNEVRAEGWPVQVNPATPTPLTSPVFDQTSGRVFVADKGGFLYRVGPLTAAVATASGPLDVSSAEGGPGIVQGPIVDSTNEVVYVFAAADGSGGSGLCPGVADCSAVYQLIVNFPEDDLGSETVVGSSTVEPAPPSPLYLGAFDSAYVNSPDGSGSLYVCGNTGGPPIMYQVPIVAGIMNSASNAGPVLSNSIGPTPCSPVSDVMNPNIAGGATEWIFASVQTQGASAGCGADGCLFNFKDTPWRPLTAYAVGQEILDSHFQIQVATVAGTSSSTSPVDWGTLGKFTTDGSVHWVSQGIQSAFTPAAWVHGHSYVRGSKILDGSNNVQVVTSTTGTSGATMPSFNPAPGGTTTDGTLTWTNVGMIATAAAPEAGGTSGIILDNIVGTLVGASQIYFSTLSDGTCGTSGTGGCAVQVSQAGLQ